MFFVNAQIGLTKNNAHLARLWLADMPILGIVTMRQGRPQQHRLRRVPMREEARENDITDCILRKSYFVGHAHGTFHENVVNKGGLLSVDTPWDAL